MLKNAGGVMQVRDLDDWMYVFFWLFGHFILWGNMPAFVPELIRWKWGVDIVRGKQSKTWTTAPFTSWQVDSNWSHFSSLKWDMCLFLFLKLSVTYNVNIKHFVFGWRSLAKIEYRKFGALWTFFRFKFHFSPLYVSADSPKLRLSTLNL